MSRRFRIKYQRKGKFLMIIPIWETFAEEILNAKDASLADNLAKTRANIMSSQKGCPVRVRHILDIEIVAERNKQIEVLRNELL